MRESKKICICKGYKEWIEKRAKSGEIDYGVWWGLYDRKFPFWRVSWIRNTGELYAVSPATDEYIILGRYETEAEVERRMEGWAESRMIITEFFPEILNKGVL